MPIQIIQSGTTIDFLGKRRICLAISLGVIILGLVAIPIRGFRLGVDFAGGTEVQVRFDTAGVDEGQIRGVVSDLGIANASVVRYGAPGTSEFLVKFAASEVENVARAAESESASSAPGDSADADDAAPPVSAGEEGEEAAGAEVGATASVDVIGSIAEALEAKLGPLSVERVEFVGPKVGSELRQAGLLALLWACLLILAYITFRFSVRFAPGAVVALIHDVLITSSIWILLGLEFDLKVLAALLAIIGYSLNDTIIVFDRIRENMAIRTKKELVPVLNQSVNQTLSRTLLTSLTTLLTVLSLLLFGGKVIQPFALAMAIGVLVGTYSSIYIAAPTLLWLEQRFGDSTAKASA